VPCRDPTARPASFAVQARSPAVPDSPISLLFCYFHKIPLFEKQRLGGKPLKLKPIGAPSRRDWQKFVVNSVVI
jgi:hypothetical protein